MHNAVRSVPCQPDHLQTSSDHKRIPAVRVQTKVLLLSTQDFPGGPRSISPHRGFCAALNKHHTFAASNSSWVAKPQQATRAAAASTNDTQVSVFRPIFFFSFLERVSVLEA